MKAIVLALALMSTGCASIKSVLSPVEVKVPVSVPCRAPEIERPTFATESLTAESDIWDMMSALRAERHQRRAYEAQLEAAIKSCQ